MADAIRSTGAAWPRRLPFYYGWVNVLSAAAAMCATLPGRTHGLGLITEPLLRDLGLERTLFAQLNLWGTLLGAAFCVPVGWLIDRFGTRVMVVAVTTALAGSVWWMSEATGAVSLFLTVVLVRGFGQSALSIVSMAMIGKWFRRRVGMAMGLFAVLLTCGFIGGILALGDAAHELGWRAAWQRMALALLAYVPLAWLLTRNDPESCGIAAGAEITAEDDGLPNYDFTLVQALRTPAFWVFALGASAFNLVWSSVMLFNESILTERGFDKQVAVKVMAILTGAGLISNLVSGKLASRRRIGPLLGVGLALLAASLACFPSVTSLWQLQTYALAMGLVGGIVTVVFFSVWGHLFGRGGLGKIQSAAQLVTVLASALGPVLMAEWRQQAGSYMPAFYALAAGVGALAIAAFVVPGPIAPPAKHDAPASETPADSHPGSGALHDVSTAGHLAADN